jgi:serine/threonine protein kinase
VTGPPLPRAVGRYEILEEIGRGPTAVTFRARDPLLDRTVVVRAVLLPTDTPQKERDAFEARLLEEGRRASLLSHPGLVAVHDCGRDPATGVLFVVQEHVTGMPLQQALVPGEPQLWEVALRLVGGVGRALQQLHAAGLVHRDVRPSNILLHSSGTPKLADSGVARYETSRLTMTSVRQAFGAPLYMSPEQAVGERVDARSDLFSLGAVAYRLLTGRDAFEADGPQKILARVVHDRPLPPSAVVPGLPSGVDEVLAKALAKSRKDRYPDANSLCDDLDDLLAGRPPRNAPSGGKKEDTASFLVAAGTDAATGETTGTGSLRLDRRPVVRGLVGLGVFALVVGLELLRRRLERFDTTPGGPRSVDPLSRGEDASLPKSGSDLPSIEEAPALIARMSIDFKHTLERGTLLVSVDGATVLERRVSGGVRKSLLGLKLREGRLREVVELAPGRHEIVVKVRWGNDVRTDRIAGNFTAGATRRLSARIGLIGKRLSVEWE